MQNSLEILEELDWCLSQLENMQSHKTISEIASSKVYRYLLN
jgi:cAMP-specific phosphodiesterase 4